MPYYPPKTPTATPSGTYAIPRVVSTINGFTAADNAQVTLSAKLYVQAGGSVRTYGSGTMKLVN